MSTTRRTLLVLRHSKSAYPEGTADFDRPLAPRGLRDAVTLGTWIRDQGLLPDLVVCSAAARARQTWELASDQLAWADGDGEVERYDERVYHADAGDLVGIARRHRPRWRSWPWWATTRPSADWCSSGRDRGLPGHRAGLPHLGGRRHRLPP